MNGIGVFGGLGGLMITRSENGVPAAETEFTDFVNGEGERLRRALVAHYGVQLGTDLHAESIGYAWERWSEVSGMDRPLGYLYRVAQSRARRYRRWDRHRAVLSGSFSLSEAPVDRELLMLLDRLSANQRVAVLLVHAYGCTYREVADLLGVPVSSVNNHISRGMERLRCELGEEERP